MSRRVGIEYFESLKDGENYYVPSHAEIHEKVTRERPRRLARLREEMNAKAAVIPLPPRSGEYDWPVTDFRTVPGISSLPNSAPSGGDDRGELDKYIRDIMFKPNGRTYGLNKDRAGPDRKYLGGDKRPGHNIASKLLRQGPGALSDVRNKDTISKDNTVGNEAHMDELLASSGKRALGMQCREPREIPDPGPELDLASKRRPGIKNIGMENPIKIGYGNQYNGNLRYLSTSDPRRSKTREDYNDGGYSNRERRQRQRLAQSKHGDEAHADLREKAPPPIPKEFQERSDAALDYIQASRARQREDEKAERDSETDDGWSVSGAQV